MICGCGYGPGKERCDIHKGPILWIRTIIESIKWWVSYTVLRKRESTAYLFWDNVKELE